MSTKRTSDIACTSRLAELNPDEYVIGEYQSENKVVKESSHEALGSQNYFKLNPLLDELAVRSVFLRQAMDIRDSLHILSLPNTVSKQGRTPDSIELPITLRPDTFSVPRRFYERRGWFVGAFPCGTDNGVMINSGGSPRRAPETALKGMRS